VSWAWESNSQYLAQVGHFLGGAIVLSIAGAFSAVLGAGWEPVWFVLGVGVALASVKEFVLDLLPAPYGEGDSFGDSLMDWCFYLLGACAGLGVAAELLHLASLHGCRS
jgi:hypothetical protein